MEQLAIDPTFDLKDEKEKKKKDKKDKKKKKKANKVDPSQKLDPKMGVSKDGYIYEKKEMKKQKA